MGNYRHYTSENKMPDLLLLYIVPNFRRSFSVYLKTSVTGIETGSLCVQIQRFTARFTLGLTLSLRQIASGEKHKRQETSIHSELPNT